VSQPADAFARLCRLAARLSQPDADEDARWFVAAVREYESGAPHGRTLDDAFGLRPRVGQTSWWEHELLQERGALIREAAKYFPAIKSRRKKADEISRALSRYRSGDWRRHRAYTTPPEELCNALHGVLFRLLKLDVALGATIVRDALNVANLGAVYVGQRSRDAQLEADEETHGTVSAHGKTEIA
jgi:hypothetical protein